MSPKPLKFLFCPIDGVGHVNAHSGIGQELLRRGHSVYFAVSNAFRGKLTPMGFVEKYYQDSSKKPLLDRWKKFMEENAASMYMSRIDKWEQFLICIHKDLASIAKEYDAALRQIVAEVQPDLIVCEGFHFPALCDAGIPWMVVISINPMGIATENVPPALCGLPVIDADKESWSTYAERAKTSMKPIFENFAEWVSETGGTKLTYDGRTIWINSSPYGNMYMFPEEMSYAMHRPDPPKWHRFDTFMRFEPTYFQIPKKLETGPGKLVYFSLGTIGCSDLKLMGKLIGILAKSPNRFIISKGPLGDELTLADNMWGKNNLPQTSILPLVNLVITHGGNNTLTESFYFGTKMLLLPIFLDQLDNGCRVEETGFGLQCDPYRVSEEELLTGIETLLANELLEKRMKSVSRRIQGSNSQARAAELMESIANDAK